MSVIVACPKCQKKLKIEDNVLGRNIKCPACAAVFAVKAPGSSPASPPPAKTAPSAPPPKVALPPIEDDEAGPPPLRSADEPDEAVSPRPRASSRPPVDEEEDDRPRRPSARRQRTDDDEDDRPRKSASRKRTDEEDDRPARSGGKAAKKKSGGAGIVLLIVGALLLLGCGGCAGVGVWIYGIYGNVKVGIDSARAAMNQGAAGRKSAESPKVPFKVDPGKPAPDTKTQVPDRPPPPPRDEPPMYASEQQFADAMYDHLMEASGRYMKQPLQLTGVARKVTLTPDGLVNEVFFEPTVENLKAGIKKPFPINCRLTKPVPKASAPVGATVTVRGRLIGGSLGSATLNECIVVSPAGAPAPPDKPNTPIPPPDKPAKPSKEPLSLKADDFAQDLYTNKIAAYRRWTRMR